MLSDRNRILELALESLEIKKKEIDQDIAEIIRELKGGQKISAASSDQTPKPAAGFRKKPRFSKEERLRRAERMKAYWDNWRKKKSSKK
jgi:hypothetical protein